MKNQSKENNQGTNQPHELDKLIYHFKSLIITGEASPIKEDATDPVNKELQALFNHFLQSYEKMNEMANNLSAGKLFEPIPKKNRMADGLKNLHAQILHLTWQAKQVARGDYSQNVDFMGDFSDAFNSMIHQLVDREKHLVENHEILLNILENMPYAVIAIANETKETLFSNTVFSEWMEDGFFHEHCSSPSCILMSRLTEYDDYEHSDKNQWEIVCPEEECYFMVNSMKILWTDGQAAYLHTLQDFSQYRTTERQLRAVAFSDDVTGIGNRLSATIHIENLLAKNSEFQVIFLDIDNLKLINDTYGHGEGDNAIKLLASNLRSSLRENDQVFRLGGDEFLVVMQSTNAIQAQHVMLRIRNRLVEETIHRSFQFSFSYGIYSRDYDDSKNVEDLIQMADMEMYKNKRRRKRERYFGQKET